METLWTGALKWRICAAFVAVAAGCFVGLTSAGADPPQPGIGDQRPNGLCLECHSQELTVVASSGEHRTMDAVEELAFGSSAHKDMECVECHTTQSALPHDEGKGRRLLAAGEAAACGACHSDALEGYLHSPHGTMVILSDGRAPSCGGCHGEAHYLSAIEDWTDDDRAEACAECHSGARSSFLDAAPLHKHASPSFLPTAYAAGLFLMALTATTLAFGIIHVELEMLRWLVQRLTGRRATGNKDDGHHD